MTGANAFGRVSQLTLTAALRQNKTALTQVEFTAPFKVMQPFPWGDNGLQVMGMSASAGIMSGDEQNISITVEQGARLEYIGQSYEKLHRMDGPGATRSTSVRVASGAECRFSPLPVIPFAGSDFSNIFRADLAGESSRFLLSDIISCGRVSRGERFALRKYSNQVEVYCDGELCYWDNTLFLPSQMPLEGMGFFEGYSHLATLLFFNYPALAAKIQPAQALLEQTQALQGGVSRLQQGALIIRMLGVSGQQLTEVCASLIKLCADG